MAVTGFMTDMMTTTAMVRDCSRSWPILLTGRQHNSIHPAAVIAIIHDETGKKIETSWNLQSRRHLFTVDISTANAQVSIPLPAKIRVENLHYDITETELYASLHH